MERTYIQDQAYPVCDNERFYRPGESIREKWAAQFMAALLSNTALTNHVNWDLKGLAEYSVKATHILEEVLNSSLENKAG